jgi:hypothetical protein
MSVWSNFYTARLLGKELNRDKATIMQWYRKGWLKGRLAGFRRGYLQTPMVFIEKDIVVFLKKHSYLFTGHKIPNVYFKNIVQEYCLTGKS